MSVLILETGDARAAALGAALDALGVHDWRVGAQVDGETLTLDLGVPEPPKDAVQVSTPRDALAAILAQPPCPPLIDGLAAYVARSSHTLNNALTPAILNVSMARASFDMQDRRALSDDLAQVSESLGALRARLNALTACVARHIAARNPQRVLNFLGRSDSALRLVHGADRVFEIEPTPETSLAAGDLEGWLLTAVADIGARGHPLTLKLTSVDDEAVLEVTRRDGTAVGWSARLRHLARTMTTAGGRLDLTPSGARLRLPPVESHGRVERAVRLDVSCQKLRQTLKNRLLFMGCPPTMTDHPRAVHLVDGRTYAASADHAPHTVVLICRADPGPLPADVSRVIVDSAHPMRFAEVIAQA